MVLFVLTSCQSKQDKLDDLVMELSMETEFNGLIYIAKNGNTLLEKKLSSTIGTVEPLNDNSKIHLASLTKLFIELVVLQLVEEGKLHMDGTISDYRKNFKPTFGTKITVQNLIQMQSGLPRELNESDLFSSLKTDSLGLAGPFLDSIPDFKLAFVPGSKTQYSNLDYWLLGSIVESVTQSTLQEAYDQYIFTPLNMKSSGYFANHDIAKSYKKVNGEWVVDNNDYHGRYASGGAYSSMDDLKKLAGSLLENALIKPSEDDFIFGENSTIEVYGSLPSITNMFYINKNEKVIAIMLNNVGVPDLNKITELKSGIMEILDIDPEKRPKAKITLLKRTALNDSIPLEKGMKEWILAIENGNRKQMAEVFNQNASENRKTPVDDPTWDEILRVREEWKNFRVYGFRRIEDENPKGLEIWFRSDGEERIAFQWIIGDDNPNRATGLFIKPDNTTWLGQKFN